MADAFEAELSPIIEKYARELAREVTALILRRLGVGVADASTAARVVHQKPARQRAVRRVVGKPKRGRPRADRGPVLDQVERAVKDGDGVSVSLLEKSTGLPRASLQAALRALKDAGRVFMGGTKRFARYAGTQAAADKASDRARSGS